jgi:hypothetical protein
VTLDTFFFILTWTLKTIIWLGVIFAVKWLVTL